MRATMIGGFLLASLAFAGAATAATTCSTGGISPLPVRNTPVPPLTSALAGKPVALASPRTLLAESRDESLALDNVLLRLKLESCVKDEFAGYKPKTEFDNTPYRFNMDKGKKFTAAEFDAWMKSRGVRVATGRAPTPAAAPVDAAAPAAAAPAATGVVAE